MMKNKLFITVTVLLLLTGGRVFAQEQTLNVFLERNPEHRAGVDLVFENNSSDTIFVSSRFDNLSSTTGPVPTHQGIRIQLFRNGNLIGFQGTPYPAEFRFPIGSTIIYPHSSIRLFFDILNHNPSLFVRNVTGKLEVGFLMNYSYTVFGTLRSQSVVHFRTNRVTMIEPVEDVE